MATYYQAPWGFGVVDDPTQVPPDGVVITEAAYNAAQAAWQTDQTTYWTNVHNAERAATGGLETVSAADFTHALTGADSVFEKIGELPDLEVPVAGKYMVSYTARGAVAIVANHAAVVRVVAQLRVNNLVVPQSEALVVLLSQSVTTEPALQAQASASVTLPVTLAAGDDLSLWAARTAAVADATANIQSTAAGGRSRITAWRIA